MALGLLGGVPTLSAGVPGVTELGVPQVNETAIAGGWRFLEVGLQAGLAVEHGYVEGTSLTEPHHMAGGLAAGDLDGDGQVDLIIPRGHGRPAVLRNLGGGRFKDLGAASGLPVLEGPGVAVGPALADVDGDGRLDLLLGGIAGASPRLWRNLGGGRFEEITAASGLFATADTFSAAFGDIDADGDLDLFLTHWSGVVPGGLPSPHLWRADGDGGFAPIDFSAGIADAYRELDWSFTPAFADLDGDGDRDLLVAGDFGTSRVFRNLGDSRFEDVTDAEIEDENGMGSALGDFDGDGVLDWFVTSIWDPDGVNESNWGVTGNRLYRGRGDGSFTNEAVSAGVDRGYWGWGTCAADFDLDGDLDLFQVNGFSVAAALSDFGEDPSRLWLNDGQGRFEEVSVRLGLDDRSQGRGVACFDADNDGDIDLAVGTNRDRPRLWRNDLPAPAGWLGVRATDGASLDGATVRVLIPDGRSSRHEIGGRNQFLSHGPPELHLGLGPEVESVDLEIRWRDGTLETQAALAVDRWHVLEPPPGLAEPVGGATVEIPTLSAVAQWLLALGLTVLALRRLRRPADASGSSR
ncbi:MAG: CRTAC1 family protein [Acidobacteriota bacterium]